jgi:hypothetical protein
MPNRAELAGSVLLILAGAGVIVVPFVTSLPPVVSVIGVLIVAFGQIGLETSLFTFGLKSIVAGAAIAGLGYATSTPIAFVGVGIGFAVLGVLLLWKAWQRRER